MRILACIALAAVACATSTAAQDIGADHPSIVVVGMGRVERDPDTFRVVANIEGQGRTQVEALEHLARDQTRVSHGLASLDGLSTAALTTDDPQVRPVRDPSCDTGYGRAEDLCVITGYRATMKLTLEGSPVARAGDAVSLAAESGAQSASLQSTYLSSDDDLQAEANRAAFLDARQQADLLAQASGQRIVRIKRIQTQGAGDGLVLNELAETVPIGRDIISVNLLAPTVRLDVAPDPVVVTSRLIVVFEIE